MPCKISRLQAALLAAETLNGCHWSHNNLAQPQSVAMSTCAVAGSAVSGKLVYATQGLDGATSRAKRAACLETFRGTQTSMSCAERLYSRKTMLTALNAWAHRIAPLADGHATSMFYNVGNCVLLLGPFCVFIPLFTVCRLGWLAGRQRRGCKHILISMSSKQKHQLDGKESLEGHRDKIPKQTSVGKQLSRCRNP